MWRSNAAAVTAALLLLSASSCARATSSADVDVDIAPKCNAAPDIQAEVIQSPLFYPLEGCVMATLESEQRAFDCYTELQFIGTNVSSIGNFIAANGLQESPAFAEYCNAGGYEDVKSVQEFCALTFEERDVRAYQGFNLPADLGASPCCNCAFCSGGVWRYPHVSAIAEQKERAAFALLIGESLEDGDEAAEVACQDKEDSCEAIATEEACTNAIIREICVESCGLCP